MHRHDVSQAGVSHAKNEIHFWLPDGLFLPSGWFSDLSGSAGSGTALKHRRVDGTPHEKPAGVFELPNLGATQIGNATDSV